MSSPQFVRVEYKSLNARQKENYNFHKVASVLADFGFNSIRLNDDWQGADFIACHVNGSAIMRVQIKGRMTIDQKYMKKNIHIAFLHQTNCYVYPHDDVMDFVLTQSKINDTRSWTDTRAYSWPTIPKWALNYLENFNLNKIG